MRGSYTPSLISEVYSKIPGVSWWAKLASQGASRHKGSAKKKKRYMLFSKKSTFDCYVALACFACRFLIACAALFCCVWCLGLPFLDTCLHIPPATNPTKPTKRVPRAEAMIMSGSGLSHTWLVNSSKTLFIFFSLDGYDRSCHQLNIWSVIEKTRRKCLSRLDLVNVLIPRKEDVLSSPFWDMMRYRSWRNNIFGFEIPYRLL